MIDSNIDDLLAELDDFTTELEQVTTVTLNQLAAEVPAQIISGLESAGKDLGNKNGKSKGLRGSIYASVNGTQIDIGMNYYGYFQIFGVSGSAIPLGGIAGSFAGKGPDDIFKFSTLKQGIIAPAPGAANTILNLSDLISELITEDI